MNISRLEAVHRSMEAEVLALSVTCHDVGKDAFVEAVTRIEREVQAHKVNKSTTDDVRWMLLSLGLIRLRRDLVAERKSLE